MTKSEVFRKLYKLARESEDYIDTLPTDISSAIFDNTHSNAIALINDLLIREYFGEHAELIFWFLYEWKPFAAVGYDDVMEKIRDIDQYIDWMKRVEGFCD